MKPVIFSANKFAVAIVFALIFAPWTPILWIWRAAAVLCGAWLLIVTVRRIRLWRAARAEEFAPNPTPTSRPDLLVLVPARNEEHALGETIESLLNLDWPQNRRKILIIDDGSTDGTAHVARAFAESRAGVEILRRNGENSGKGKPAALNAALESTPFGEWVYVVDADARVAPDAPARLIDQALRSGAAAAQGAMTVRNADRSPVAAYAAMESMVHQEWTQRGAQHLGDNVMLLGSNYVVRRDRLARFDGFTEGTRLEDVDLCVALQSRGDAVVFVPEAFSTILACENPLDAKIQHRAWSAAFRDIARRRWIDIWVGPLATWKKIDLSILVAGYLDRPAAAVYALCLIAQWRADVFVAPWCVLAVYALVAAIQILWAYPRVIAPGANRWRDLLSLLLGDLVDHTMSFLQTSPSENWIRTRRTPDDSARG